MENKKILIVLFLIILLGLLLRVYGIGSESFWIDEAATVYTTQQDASEIIEDIYTTTKHAPEYTFYGGTPPFYFLLANYWTSIFGLDEVKLRLLSVLFSVISIYFIFRIGKMIFDHRVGLVAALIFSINYMHIHFSQEARVYSLSTLLALLTVYFLLNALKKKETKHWIAYVLASVLLIYANYFGFLILFFEYVFLLFFWKKYRISFKNVAISGLGIFILYLPWLPVLIRQVFDSDKLIIYFGSNVLYDFGRMFVQFNSWFTPDLQTRIALRDIYHSAQISSTSNLFEVSLPGWIAIISVLALVGLLSWYFIVSIFSHNKKISTHNLKDKNYIFLLMWFLVPILIPMLITLIFPSKIPVFGFTQYVLFALPAYYLLIAKGILKSKKYPLILVLLIILTIFPMYSYYSNIDKQQWEEAANYLEVNREGNEVVVINSAIHVLALRYYYDDMDGVVGIKNVEELKSNIENEDSVWLIYAGQLIHDPKLTIKNHLDKNFNLTKKAEFVGIKIFRYADYN